MPIETCEKQKLQKKISRHSVVKVVVSIPQI